MRLWTGIVAVIAVIAGTMMVRAQFLGAPGGPATQTMVQFNTNGLFGGITGLTSDGISVGFATNSQPILYGQTAGNCLTVDANFRIISQSCSAGSQTSIAAGSNITTSGSSGNVTVNVVATPSFTTVIASGNVTGGTAQFTGLLTGANAVFQTLTVSNLTPTGPNCLQETAGVLQATNAACASATGTGIAAGTNITTSGTASNVTINVVATPSFTTVIATGNLTATTVQVSSPIAFGAGPAGVIFLSSGNLSNTNFTLTVPGANDQLMGRQTTDVLSNKTFDTSGNILRINGQSVTATTGNVPQIVTASGTLSSGHCPQWDANRNLIDSGSATCGGTQVATISIAQGNNIVTSGTASNITVTATPTGPSGAVQFDNAGVFGGDSGFQYAGSSTGIATLTLGTITTTNSKALSLIGNWSNSTTTFAAPLFVNIITNTTGLNTTNGFGAGSKLTDIQASSASIFTVFTNGATVNSSLTSTTAQVVGWLTGPGANLQTATIAGALIGSTGNFSSNLTGTTANFSSNLTANIAQFAGFLSAGGASLSGLTIQTETLTSNLTGTTANFSSNLTGNIAQFAGFMSAGGASISGLTIQTATFSSNLTGTTANFSSNLTANIAQFAGFLTAGGASLSGLTIQTETLTGNLTGTTGNFSSFLTASGIAAFPAFLTASGASFNSVSIVTNLTGSQANFSSTLTASIYTGTGTGAGALAFITPGISEFGLGSPAAAHTGWMNWGGESRLAADFGLNISNAGLTATTLSVNVQGGRTYSIDADLYVTLAVAATSGIAISLSGTYGSTDTHYFGYVVDGGSNTSAAGTSNPIRGATLATAKNTIVGNVSLSGTTGYVALKGTISVNTAGTLLIAAATVNTQTAANGVSLTRGSRILVQDMP